MQDLADSTTDIDTVTHSKLPSYLQPCNDSLIQSRDAYGLDDGVAFAYATVTATIRLSSSHHRQMSSSPDEPHLSDCRSPSDSTDGDIDANKEILFRPINFDDISVGTCRSLALLTPPEFSNSSGSTSGSSDSGSSNEDVPDDGLLVRIPRRASDSMIVTNNQPRCEPKLKEAKATSGSSDSGSSNEDVPDDGLLVRIPRRASDSMVVANNQPRCEPKLKEAKALENEHLQVGLRNSSRQHHGITINLLDKDLWKMFESIGNEMIVMKPGR